LLKRLVLLGFVCCVFARIGYSQENYSITVINKNSEPIAFAVGVSNDTILFSNRLGELNFKTKPERVSVYAIGYNDIRLDYYRSQVILEENNFKAPNANSILYKVSENKATNNPDEKLSAYGFERYNKTLISRDSVEYKSTNENLFSERVSRFEAKHNSTKEYVEAQKNQGFEEPILRILTTRMHDINWYEDIFTIFEIDFESPLHRSNFSGYAYDLIHVDNSFFYVKFTPKKGIADRLVEGVVAIDKNYAITEIYVNKDDEIKLDLYQSYTYNSKQRLWLTKEIDIKMTPGKGGKTVSIFGSLIDIGKLQPKTIAKEDINNQLISKSLFYNYKFDFKDGPVQDYDILVDKNAHNFNSFYWENQRKIPLTEKDSLFFKGIKETIERQNTITKIKRVESFNKGFFPILQWKTDLKTLFRLNNYEGIRLGIGGMTNEDFSDKFRFGGYVAYGTKDGAFKYGLNTGFLLNSETDTWLNMQYTDDVREVGSSPYLTDQRVYTILEPRLVNIIFFYKEKSSSIGLQKRIRSDLLSEFKIAYDRIEQTRNYAYLNGDMTLQSYDLTRAVLSLRWSPNSKFLKFDNNFANYNEGYPVFSGQVEQYLGQAFGGDLTFTKFNLKAQYVYNHLNANQTEVTVEGNYVTGNVPLTHTFHAYPNAPNKGSVLERITLAGVRTFETMFFSEFFSTKLASLHLKHKLSPFKISDTFRPQLVLISRHAIGDFDNPENHLGVDFNTLDDGFSEAGLELNKLFYGFGLSFAYRYGANHLPVFEDNLSFKFTFNLQF